MRRKSYLIAGGLLLLFISLFLAILGLLIKHKPSYYRELEETVDSTRRSQSGEFVTQLSNLRNGIMNRDRDWGEAFTANQINSYFQEDFVRAGGDANLPDGFHDPRIVIDSEKWKLGIRYGCGFWSTIITVELRTWLVAEEVNTIGMEILNLQAGALPLSSQILLDYITEAARQANMSLTWYRHKGNPVAILRYQADQLYPTLVIHRLDFHHGKLILQGRSTDAR